jgi:hypothetical protein
MNIAYDQSVSLRAQEILEIPLNEISLPFTENLICVRECRERGDCPCRGEPQIALASVVLAVDANDDGALSLDEVRAEQVGTTSAMVGYSLFASELPPLDWLGSFERTEAGMCAYVTVSAQKLSAMDQDAPEPFHVCADGRSDCSTSATRMFCSIDCNRDWGLNRLGL